MFTRKSHKVSDENDVLSGSSVMTPKAFSSSKKYYSSRSKSPLNVSRDEEKEVISHLNDRLASYIDYVRSLELSKEQLNRRISQFSDFGNIDESKIRKEYEDEILALKKALDDINKNKALSEKKAKTAEDQARDALKDKRLAEGRLAELELNISKLQKEIDNEILHSTQYSNKIQTLQDELSFQARLAQQESKQLKNSCVIDFEQSKVVPDFDTRLAEEMRNYRAEVALELENYRQKIQGDLDAQMKTIEDARNSTLSEVNELRVELMRTDRERETYQKELEGLQAQLERLQNDLNTQRALYADKLKRLKDSELSLRDQIEQKMLEFAELMTIKISLDQEILAYRKLLEGEAYRLNLEPPCADSSFSEMGRSSNKSHTGSTSGSAYKRRRINQSGLDADSFDGLEDSSSSGHYEISRHGSGSIMLDQVDTRQGKFIKIVSNVSEEVSLAGWVLKFEIDGSSGSHKFSKQIVIKPHDTITVWNSNSGRQNEPPQNIVMRSNLKLTNAKRVELSLVDADGKEQSGMKLSFELNPGIQSSAYKSVSRTTPSSYSSQSSLPTETLTSHHGSDKSTEEKCYLM